VIAPAATVRRQRTPEPKVAGSKVRAWLEKMVAAMRFVELIMAVIGLITRMRDINLELTKRVAHPTRKRPRSETSCGGGTENSPAWATAAAVATMSRSWV
jgi:hypothetical protein